MSTLPKPSPDSIGAGAPEDEIITPEMIAAGVIEIERFDFRFGRRSDVVERIFMAMWYAQREVQSS
jgi:hypothetical protein